MSSPTLNVSGIDFTPPASLLTTAAATTVATSAAKASTSILSRIPWWIWLIVISIAAYFAYAWWQKRESKINRALDIAEDNKRRLNDNDDPLGGLSPRF